MACRVIIRPVDGDDGGGAAAAWRRCCSCCPLLRLAPDFFPGIASFKESGDNETVANPALYTLARVHSLVSIR